MKNIEKRTVMIVDNEQDILDMLKIMIDDRYGVLPANGSREALEQLRKAERKPDLILLDISMPELDGWKLLDEIQQDEQLKKIPVAMLTASRLENSSVNNIIKPVTRKELLEFIEKIFESRSYR